MNAFVASIYGNKFFMANIDLCGKNVLANGLVGDGTTNDATALQALIDSCTAGDIIYFPNNKTYLINTSITLTKKLIFVGFGAKIKTTSAITIFAVSTAAAKECEFYGLDFVGDNDTNQIGISFDTAGRFIVDSCKFVDFDKGVTVTNTEGTVSAGFNENVGGRITRSTFYANATGVDLLTRGEYVTISHCDFNKNTQNGIRTAGGNFIITDNNITYNENGIQVVSGANNAHGIIANNNINHNKQFSLRLFDFTFGLTVENNHIYQADIYIKNTTGVRILGGQIVVGNLYFENSTGIIFSNVTFDTSYGNNPINNYLSTVAVPTYVNCWNMAGQNATNSNTFV